MICDAHLLCDDKCMIRVEEKNKKFEVFGVRYIGTHLSKVRAIFFLNFLVLLRYHIHIPTLLLRKNNMCYDTLILKNYLAFFNIYEIVVSK